MDINSVNEGAVQPPSILEQMLIDDPSLEASGSKSDKLDDIPKGLVKIDELNTEAAIKHLPYALKQLQIADKGKMKGRARKKREDRKFKKMDLSKANEYLEIFNLGAGPSASLEFKETENKEKSEASVMEGIETKKKKRVEIRKGFRAPSKESKECDIEKEESAESERSESPVLQIIGGAEKETEEESKKIEPYNFIEIRSENQFLDGSKKSLYSVYYFYRNKVVQCPILDKHMNELDPKRVNTKFYKIDADKSQYLYSKLHVRFLPFIMLFKNGFIYDKIAGFYELNTLEEFFSEKMYWHSLKYSVKVSEKHPRSHSSGNRSSKRPRIALNEDPMVNIRSHHSAESDSDE